MRWQCHSDFMLPSSSQSSVLSLVAQTGLKPQTVVQQPEAQTNQSNVTSKVTTTLPGVLAHSFSLCSSPLIQKGRELCVHLKTPFPGHGMQNSADMQRHLLAGLQSSNRHQRHLLAATLNHPRGRTWDQRKWSEEEIACLGGDSWMKHNFKRYQELDSYKIAADVWR
jgi:hypothetical protein